MRWSLLLVTLLALAGAALGGLSGVELRRPLSTPQDGAVPGVVTLDVAVAVPTVVSLRASIGLSTPASVTIPAGATSASFTATLTGDLPEEEVAEVIAESDGSLRASEIALVSPARKTGLGDVAVYPGTSAVLVTWRPLPSSAFRRPSGNSNGTNFLQGYTISRTDWAGNTVVVAPVALKNGMSLDTSAFAGARYTYKVLLCRGDRSVIASGTSDETVPLGAGGPVLTTTQNLVVSGGRLTGRFATSQGGRATGYLMVDGEKALSFYRRLSRYAPSQDLFANTSSATLGEGKGTVNVRAVAIVEDRLAVGPMVTLATDRSSPLLVREIGDLVDPLANETVAYRFSLRGNIGSSWSLVLSDEAGAVQRPWTGTSRDIDIRWDGRTSAGVAPPPGGYTGVLTYQVNGSPASLSFVTNVRSGNPNFLGLLRQTGEESPDAFAPSDRPEDVVAYARKISQSIPIRTPGYLVHVLAVGLDNEVSSRLRLRIRKWMKSSVEDFYYYGHGEGDSFSWGGLEFRANRPFYERKFRDLTSPEGCLTVSWIVSEGPSGRTFNSAIIDACSSAGAGGPVDYSLSWAFGIVGIEDGAFIGWNGLSGNLRTSNPLVPDTTFKRFWYRFWDLIAAGQHITQAAANAKRSYARPAVVDSSMLPESPSNRLFLNGGFAFLGG